MNATDVFINCPFSADYKPKFRAIVYTVIRSGFEPRCALEADNSAENRYAKICRIIKECRYGIHDISYTGQYGDPAQDADFPLPRFNMPFELGLFLGAHSFGGRKQSAKSALILDIKPYRFQKFLSDIAGHDPRAYDAFDMASLIEQVATWLRVEAQQPKVPGSEVISDEFERFMGELPRLCQLNGLNFDRLSFFDFSRFAREWIIDDEDWNIL